MKYAFRASIQKLSRKLKDRTRIGVSRTLLETSRRRRPSCAACKKILRNFKAKRKHRQSFAWMAVDNDSGQSRRGCLCDSSSTNDFIRNHKPRNDSVWPGSRSVPVFFSLFFFSGQEKPMETDYSWRKCDGKSIAGRCVERCSFSTTSGAFWRWNRGRGSDISRTRGNRFHFQWNEPSYSLRDGKCLFSSYSVTYNGESLLTSKRYNSLRYVCSFGISPLEGEGADSRVTTTKASEFHEFFFYSNY